jgi:flagellar protein FliS
VSSEQEGDLQAVGYGAYQRIQAETSSPAELILLLYDALLKDLNQARARLIAHDHETANRALIRAQEIILELISSLDLSAGEIAQQLAPLYHYEHQRLLDANVQKDPEAVSEVIGLVTPLRDAWVQAIQTVQAGRA